jgi:hypothetical protein
LELLEAEHRIDVFAERVWGEIDTLEELLEAVENSPES